MFIAARLRVIILYHDTVLELSRLYVLQPLSLNDVLEAAFVAIALQFAEKEQLMALKLLYSLVQRRDRIEHLIVFILELKPVLLCLSHLLLHHLDL